MKIIEIDNPDDVFERALATLLKWKEKQGQDATYKKLARALDDELVQRRDLVETFCCDIYPSKQLDINVTLGREGVGWGTNHPHFEETKGCEYSVKKIKASALYSYLFVISVFLV